MAVVGAINRKSSRCGMTSIVGDELARDSSHEKTFGDMWLSHSRGDFILSNIVFSHEEGRNNSSHERVVSSSASRIDILSS